MRRPTSEEPTLLGTFVPTSFDEDWSEEDGPIGIELRINCSIDPDAVGSLAYEGLVEVDWLAENPDLVVSISVKDELCADPVLLQAMQLRCIAHLATLYPGNKISFWLRNDDLGVLAEHRAPANLNVVWMLQGRQRYSRVEIPPEKLGDFVRAYRLMVTGIVMTRTGLKIRLRSKLFSDLDRVSPRKNEMAD